MNFDIEQKRRPSNRDKSMIKTLNSPTIVASGFSNTVFLPSDPDDFRDRLNFLLYEKLARNNSDLNNEEIIAMVDKLLELKCISKKQRKQIFLSVIFCTQRRSNYKDSDNWYTRMSIITQINVCKHKFKYS